jgi:type IX secretion system PorP/SprF family membrane protein
MRKLKVLVFTMFFSVIAFAQQFPLQSQYQFNYSVINPSVIVENDFTSVRASFRQQWVGFSDRPIATQYLSMYKGFGNNGLGISFFNDETGGAFNKTGLSFSYAHKVLLAESESELFLGISGGASKVNISNISDPAIINSNDIYPEVTFGIYLKKNDLRFGVSIPGLLNENIELTNSADNIIESNIYTMISYQYQLNKDITVLPSVLLKSTKERSQVDANVNLKFNNKIWVGASYRQDFGPSIFVGLDLGKLFSIYSHDSTTNDAYSYSNGSNEFTIGYDFNSALDSNLTSPIVKVDEFLFDKDNDGVKDSIDLCPETFGSINAYGCLDNDKDGIPNDYDLCPNLHGELNLQGCPEITQFEKKIVYDALNDLNFDVGISDINYSSYSSMSDMNLLLLKNPNMFLHITGFSSSEGTEDYNLGLSARRAKAVQKFFIERGINKSRLILDYYGEENPLNENSNESQKAVNRRVEFSLEYHIYAIDEINDLRVKFKKELNEMNLDVSFLNSTNFKPNLIDTFLKNSKDVNLDVDEKINIEAPNIDIKKEITLNKSKEELITEENINSDVKSNDISNKYILVISAFTNEVNAKKYISNNPSSKYILSGDKYYIYEEARESKEDLIFFKRSYNKESWIKEIK